MKMLFRIYETAEAEETVIMALRKGINFIDSGPHYGYGAAEIFLGRVKYDGLGVLTWLSVHNYVYV